jgi:hypothetical protein
MKRIALALAAIATAAAFSAPADAAQICLPVVDFTGLPICLN